MDKRTHSITETRDWARIILAAGTGIALIILAAHGDLSSALIAAAATIVREPSPA